MRCLSLLLMMLICCGGTVAFSSQETSSEAVEFATGPEGLLNLEKQEKMTVRALRAWGRLPDKYIKLAGKMRQEAGRDLLSADLKQIEEWLAEEDPALAGMRDTLRDLAVFMEKGDHLEWSAAEAGQPLPEGTLVRQGDKRWIQTAPATPPEKVSKETASVSPEPQPEPPAAAATAPAETPAPAASMAAAQGEGLEFRINDQIAGTFHAKLRVDGVQRVRKEDERFFQVMLPQVLPKNPSVKKLEQKLFENRGENLPANPTPDSGGPAYDLYLGLAEIGKPITVRVDAPEEPPIFISEKQKKGGASYKIVGRDFLFLKTDEARGDAETGYAENRDGTITWTPRRDAETGLPVGPRAIGIYMAYRVQKAAGTHVMGTLRRTFHRIGWVMVAMPGDLYGDTKALYTVGEKMPVAGEGAAPNWTWPVPAAEKFDFELPPTTNKRKDLRLSEDMRHAAWVEGEEGRQRVVLNGVPGKWYSEVPGYRMKFSSGGESFCFAARLGEKEISVCNGLEGPPLDDIKALLLSKDGAHNLVLGSSGGQKRVFVDDVQIRETDADLGWDAAIAVDGTAAWIESDRATKKETIFTSAGYESPSNYKSIIGKPQFTERPIHLYYVAEKEDGKRHLIRDGEELNPPVHSGDFSVTSDSTFYAYVSSCGVKCRYMVMNGKIGPEFMKLWKPAVFNADGSRYAYKGYRDKKAFLVLNEKVFAHNYGTIEDVRGLTFSPDGERWAAAFALSEGKYVVLADGKEIANRSGSPSDIVFSPDGTRIAWFEKAARKIWRLVVDGKPGPAVGEMYTKDPPQFSPDGKQVVYFHADKDKKIHLSVWEGKERVHEIIVPRAIFKDDNIEYLAIDGNRFRRERIPLKP